MEEYILTSKHYLHGEEVCRRGSKEELLKLRDVYNAKESPYTFKVYREVE